MQSQQVACIAKSNLKGTSAVPLFCNETTQVATEAHVQTISKIVAQFKQNWTEEISPCSIKKACDESKMKWIESMLNPVVCVQLFFLQVLHGNTACNHLPRLADMCFTGGAYCRARMRVKLEVFERLLASCIASLKTQTLDTGLWFGRRVFMLDGSSFSMSDLPALQAKFGQPGGQKPGCGFPVSHWLVLMHLGTGMITKMLSSPLRTSDMTRIVEVHPELKQGDVLLADRIFCSFAHVALLMSHGVDVVFRIHQQIIVDFTPSRPHVYPHRGTGSKRKGLPRSRWLRSLGVQDQVVAWIKNPRGKPKWMTQEQYESLPEEIEVRELRYQVHRKGFRVKQVTLLTTLLAADVFTLEELADLYRHRWEIETNFGHIKTTMKMDILKCETVDGVLRELHVFAIVYNLIRQVMISAAHRQKVAVNRISFIDALRWLQNAQEADELTNLVVLPLRPYRYEPRVRKRRPKKYKLMTKTRNELKQELASQ